MTKILILKSLDSTYTIIEYEVECLLAGKDYIEIGSAHLVATGLTDNDKIYKKYMKKKRAIEKELDSFKKRVMDEIDDDWENL